MIKTDKCPECGCKEFLNKNLVGDGYRMCKECHQDWWIDIEYTTSTHVNDIVESQ